MIALVLFAALAVPSTVEHRDECLAVGGTPEFACFEHRLIDEESRAFIVEYVGGGDWSPYADGLCLVPYWTWNQSYSGCYAVLDTFVAGGKWNLEVMPRPPPQNVCAGVCLFPSEIFSAGFETGDLSEWSGAAP